MSADVARLKRAETNGEFTGAELHVDGNEAELVQRLDQQVGAGRRQRDDDRVDAMNARVLDQLIDRTENPISHAPPRQDTLLPLLTPAHPPAPPRPTPTP